MGNGSSLKSKKNDKGLLRQSSPAAPDVTSRIYSNIKNLAIELKEKALEDENVHGITPNIITNYLCSENRQLGNCLFNQFLKYCLQTSEHRSSDLSLLSVDQFVHSCNHFIALITDSELLSYFVHGYSKEGMLGSFDLENLLGASYQFAYLHTPELCPDVAKTVVDSILHGKEKVSVGFTERWFQKHCSRLVYWMHRKLANNMVSFSGLDKTFPTNALEVSENTERGIFDTGSCNITNEMTAKNSSENFVLNLPSCSTTTSSELSLRESLHAEIVSQRKVSTGDVENFAEKETKPSVTARRKSSLAGIAAYRWFHDRSKMPDALCFRHNARTRAPRPSASCCDLLHLSHASNREIIAGLKKAMEALQKEEADMATPVLDNINSVHSLLSPSLVFLLTCSLPPLYTKYSNSVLHIDDAYSTMRGYDLKHWELLYNSDRDGLSMNRFQTHVMHYRGPTLALFNAHNDEMVFCIVLDEEWRDYKNFWGGEHCMLLQIRPHYRILERGPQIMYFNLQFRGYPTGIQVGGDHHSRTLVVDQDLTRIMHHNVPYKLGSIEVWGCGPPVIREQQQEHRRRLDRDVEQRKKIQINDNNWREHPDRYLLQMATVAPSYADAIYYEPANKHCEMQTTSLSKDEEKEK